MSIEVQVAILLLVGPAAWSLGFGLGYRLAKWWTEERA